LFPVPLSPRPLLNRRLLSISISIYVYLNVHTYAYTHTHTHTHTHTPATDTGQKTFAAEAGNEDSLGPASLLAKAAAAREAAEAAKRMAAAAREVMGQIKSDERAAADRFIKCVSRKKEKTLCQVCVKYNRENAL
jgi:hypothetical protein